MDPGLLPLFSSCGTGDVDAAASAECGKDMQSLCSGGFGDAAQGGVLTSMLLNRQSNCSRWMSAVQEVGAVLGGGARAPGAPALDAAMRTYCLEGAGSLTAECACLSFPQRAAAWCSVSRCTLGAQWEFLSLSSDAALEQACPALEFGQQRPDTHELDVVQFGNCAPYACWLSDCFKPPSQQLLSSQVLAAQYSGSCPQVCGQFVQSNRISISPMPPGAFSFTGDVAGIAACCSNPPDCKTNPVDCAENGTCWPPDQACCPLYPALLASQYATWTEPVNGRFVVPSFVTNDGDFPALLTLSASSVPFCTVQPSSFNVLSHAVAQFNVVCDQAVVAALYSSQSSQTQGSSAPKLSLAPEFTFVYPDMSNVGADGPATATWTMGCGIDVGPASGPIYEQDVALPPWFWLFVVVAVVVGVVCLAWSWRVEHVARALALKLPE
jgi:hypothetical protein